MAQPNVFADFEGIRSLIPVFTVERLKHVMQGLNDECHARLSKTGKKQELIDRIQSQMADWRNRNATAAWASAKTVINHVRQHGSWTNNRASTSATPQMYTTYMGAPRPALPTPYGVPSSSTSNPAAAYARPRPPAPPKPPIRFKESPFIQVLDQVSVVQECRESTSATDRRSEVFNFVLKDEHLVRLRDGSHHQLRLFCTSSTFHSASPYRQINDPCLIEFPPTCEVRINGTQLTANLKGMKKKPGTAPPPNITSHANLNSLPNRVEMIYVNSQQPVTNKKFYLVVMLVRVTSVEKLVDQLKQSKRRSAIEIKAAMASNAKADDDIIAGATKMSLKCPLSYVRVSTPCRSAKCVHSQCFDALSWYSVMEQTTTWLCPVCERTLDPSDLIVDGYFDEIVKHTPEDVEDVVVEADGEWHTSDNKFASPAWKAAHPLQPAPAAKAKLPTPVARPQQPTLKKSRAEVFVIDDSDDEDAGIVKEELRAGPSSSASSSAHGPSLSQSSQSSRVIDLTLSDDEDDPPHHPPPQAVAAAANGSASNSKRKASDADIGTGDTFLWKKIRTGEPERPGPQVNGSPVRPAYPNVGTSNPHRPLNPLSANNSYLGGWSGSPSLPQQYR
ncbi:PINIT domain-containing protein [Flagelloscypha sp. PMI_526]|nr:PINIT domain-containing protein [Flagelloscypha sp. PMI_526]